MPFASLTFPQAYPLTIYAGDSFTRSVLVREKVGTPIDLTGLVARAQIRDRPDGTLLATITTAIPVPVDGVIELSMDANTVRALPGAGTWDLELDGGVNNIHTIIVGPVKVTPDVTQV